MLKSQKKANKKWAENNKSRYKYLKDRSSAFSFVKPKTKEKKERLTEQEDYKNDLIELKSLINKKLKKHI